MSGKDRLANLIISYFQQFESWSEQEDEFNVILRQAELERQMYNLLLDQGHKADDLWECPGVGEE